MIIRMKRQANRVMAEHISATFQRQGFDVQIKNGDGRFIIAVLGAGSDQIDPLPTRSLAGIERVERSNEFFNLNYGEFTEASEFFRL